jgi:hypothetical protein
MRGKAQVLSNTMQRRAARLNNEDLVELEKPYVLAEQPEELQNGAQNFEPESNTI